MRHEVFAVNWRRTIRGLAMLLVAACLVAPPSAVAQEDRDERIEQLEEKVDELRRILETRDDADLVEIRRQIDAITVELERLRLGSEVVAADSSIFGFGPAASKIYATQQGVSIGGYGEALYENFAGEREDGAEASASDQFDFLRAIIYAGYKFNDRFLLNTEFEFEHASTSIDGSASVEFAYLDYLFAENAGIRAGMLLLPIGFINELHEPTTWLGAIRPVTESRIIPSTWRENGFGVFADLEDVSLRAYVVNGLDGTGGFSASGLRGGRQKGSNALAEDFALAARADYTGQPGFVLGGSAYIGGSGQGADDPLDPGEEIGARTVIVEGHAGYKANGFDLRGLFAMADVSDVESLNAVNGFTGMASVGERLEGWYVQAGYDVLRYADTDVALEPYLRYESVNTQAEVPDGFMADPANDLTVLSIGAALRPIPEIIVKTDYQIQSTEAETGVDQFNVSFGYIF
ncbi:MAG: hypothetical protein ACODAA_03685 [Gemmatimonadota bacterium]